MLLGTTGTSLLGNMLANTGVNSATGASPSGNLLTGKGVIRVGKE